MPTIHRVKSHNVKRANVIVQHRDRIDIYLDSDGSRLDILSISTLGENHPLFDRIPEVHIPDGTIIVDVSRCTVDTIAQLPIVSTSIGRSVHKLYKSHPVPSFLQFITPIDFIELIESGIYDNAVLGEFVIKSGKRGIDWWL